MFSSVPASKLNNQDHFAVAPNIPQQEEQQHMPPNVAGQGERFSNLRRSTAPMELDQQQTQQEQQHMPPSVAGQGERFVKLRRSAVPMELDQQQRDIIAAASGGKMKKNTFVESFGIPHDIIPANVAAHFPSATEYFPSLANMWDPVSTSPEQLGRGQQQQIVSNTMTEYSRLAICQSLQSRRQGLSMYDFDRHADVHNRRVKRLDDLVRGLQAKGRHRMGRVKGLQRGAGGETGNTDQLLHDLLQQQQRSASPMLNNNDGAMMMSSTSGAAARHWHSTENEAAMASSITRIGKLKEKSRQMDITVSNDFISPGDGTAASEKKILDEAKKTFVLSFEQPESVSMALIASHFPNTSSRSFAEFTSNSAATPSLNIPLAEEEFQRFEPLRERRARIAMLEQFRNIAAAIRREELLVRRQAILEDKALRSRDVIQCHNRVKRQVLSGVNKAEVELNASYDGNAKAIALFPATVLSYTNPKNFILVSDLPVRGVTYGDVERHFPNTSARMRHRMADLQMKIQTQLAATPMARNKDINKKQGILAMGGGGVSSRKNASFSNKNKSLIAGSAAHQSWDLLQQEAPASLDSTTAPSAMTLDEVSYVDDLRANAVDSEDRAGLRFALLPFIRRHTALFDWNIRHKSADYRRSEFERAKIFAAFDNDVWRSREAALRRAKMLNNRIANNELKMSSAEHRRAAILNGRVQNLLQKDMLRQKKLQRAADWRKERKAAGLPLSDPLMENLTQKERFAQYKNIDDVPLPAEPVMDFTDPKPAFLTLDTVGAHFPNASRVYSSCNELNNRVWNRRERVAERAADKSDAASDRYKTLMAEKQAKLQELDRIRKEKVAKAKQNRTSNTNTPNDSNLAAGATGADRIITSDQSQPTMANLVVEARPMMMMDEGNDGMNAEVDNNQQRDVMAAGGAGAGTGADHIITSDQSQPTMANLVVEAGPIMMDNDAQLQQDNDMAAGAANIMTSDQQQPHGSNVVAGAKPIMNDNDADTMMKAKNQEMASPLQAEKNPHPSVDMAAGEAGASTGASDIITADQQQPNASNVVTEQDDQQKSLPASDVKSRSAPLASAAPATAAAATTEEKMKAEAAQPSSAPSASSAQQQQKPAQDPPILMNAPKPRESKTGRKGLLCC